jgi:predicted ATP-dependent endonuclease of OLD family
MKLISVKYSGFRCFGKDEMTISIDELTTFIGTNGSGKTSALIGLQRMFSNIPNDRIIHKNDFHLENGVDQETNSNLELYIEAVFSFPELSDSADSSDAIPIFFKHFIVSEPAKAPILRIRLEASWEKDASIEGSIQTDIYYIRCSETEKLTNDMKVVAKRHDLNKIRLIYVPAQRNPETQLRNVSGSMLYHLLNGINWSEETKSNLIGLTSQLNKVVEKEHGVSVISKEIQTQWKAYDYDARYDNAVIQFNSPDLDSLVKKCELIFMSESRDRTSLIGEVGDGLGSLFYFSLVDSLLSIEKSIKAGDSEWSSLQLPIVTILAIEEPENHIAPHLLGKLMMKFKKIGEGKDAQSIITTHSPGIIKRINPENIRYFKMDKTYSTTIKKITLPESTSESYIYVKEAVSSYPEIYFSKLVILGEGDSEDLVISRILDAEHDGADSSGVSVVPLGGRFIHSFWKLLSNLEIPVITLLDLDSERYLGGWGRVKYVLDQLIATGAKKEVLLCLEGESVLSDSEFLNMPKWEIDRSNLKKWILHLEKYDVFFSHPLDLDFSMLTCFFDEYKSILSAKEGPFIPGLGKIIELEEAPIPSTAYLERIENDAKNTLKSNGGDGSSYTAAEKKLMIWYNYFFLNRGKPVTHFSMLANISDAMLIEKMPKELKRLVNCINQKLRQIPTSRAEELK